MLTINRKFKNHITNLTLFLTLLGSAFILHYLFYLLLQSSIDIKDINNFALLTGQDPYFYASMLKSLLDPNYTTPFTTDKNLAFIPFLYSISKILDLNFKEAITIIPMLLGAFIAPFFYFLSTNLIKLDLKVELDKKDKFILGALSIGLSIYPAVLHRTFAGWIDTDIVILPGILLFLYLIAKFTLNLTNMKNNNFTPVIYASLIATIIFLITTYNNNILIIVSTLLLLVAYISLNLYKNNSLSKEDVIFLEKHLILTIGLIFISIHLLDVRAAAITISTFFILLMVLYPFITKFALNKKSFLILALVLLSLILLSDPYLAHFLAGKIESYLIRPFQHISDEKIGHHLSIYIPSVRTDIGELVPTGFVAFNLGSFGVPFLGSIMILAYFYFLIKEKFLSFFIFLPVFLLGLSMFISGNRFFIYFIIPFSFTFGFVYYYLKYYKKVLTGNKWFYFEVFYITFIGIYLIFNLMGDTITAKHNAKFVEKIVTSVKQNIKSLNYKSASELSKDKNVDLIIPWWEYGYSLGFYTQRLPMPNNGKQDVLLKMLWAGIYYEKDPVKRKCYANGIYKYVTSTDKHKKAGFMHILKVCNSNQANALAAKNYPYKLSLYASKDYLDKIKFYNTIFNKNLKIVLSK